MRRRGIEETTLRKIARQMGKVTFIKKGLSQDKAWDPVRGLGWNSVCKKMLLSLHRHSLPATSLLSVRACYFLGFMTLVSTMSWGQDLSLESRRLHLGKVGQFEWEMFQHQPVDAERLERRFQSHHQRC